MAKESERVRQMKENFMELHMQGFSIREIAEKYNLSPRTVYQRLQDIADANKVSRDSLLQIVRTPSEKAYREEAKRVKVNMEELEAGFREVGNILDSLIGMLDEILQEESKNEGYEI